jgi:HAD superfamily hydrolase (TIGR01509 family)
VPSALLLDLGYVVMEVSWSTLRAYEAATGLAMPHPDELMPYDDPRWDERGGGRPPMDRYWDEVSRQAGFDGFPGMFRTIAATIPEAMFDPAALELMDDARRAHRPVGVLSNDAYTILGREYFAGRPELAGLDTFVDAAEIGVRKPEAEAYRIAARALGVEPEEVVFLDDTPECVDGATAVGMTAILVDPFDRTPAFDRARELLGLARDAS